MDIKLFFESVPPGKKSKIDNPNCPDSSQFILNKQNIEIHCSSKKCGSVRFFQQRNYQHINFDKPTLLFVNYVCKNCGEFEKIYSILLSEPDQDGCQYIEKLGEIPPYGPPTPSKMMNLIGPERELFLKGRRCETQGMGIGAFVYYRRVIDSQRKRIFDEIIKVVSTVAPQDDILEELEKAKEEAQFSKAVSLIKHAMPQSLMINGHNPLSLLHGALSEAVHNLSDEQCLSLAQSVRTVLAEFSLRLSDALKDDAELNSAVSFLASRNFK